MAKSSRTTTTTVSVSPARRCPSRQYNRAPLGEPPAQAARTARQHAAWTFHH